MIDEQVLQDSLDKIIPMREDLRKKLDQLDRLVNSLTSILTIDSIDDKTNDIISIERRNEIYDKLIPIIEEL